MIVTKMYNLIFLISGEPFSGEPISVAEYKGKTMKVTAINCNGQRAEVFSVAIKKSRSTTEININSF